LRIAHAPIGYWLLAIGYWLLAIGYWLLAIGYRLSAIGYSRSAALPRPGEADQMTLWIREVADDEICTRVPHHKLTNGK
jgi:hypothetical protein